MTTLCSACASKEACEMSSHSQAGNGTALLIALQWALTAFGLFCLVGAAVIIALTPEAWPL